MMLQLGKQIISKHILPNFSSSKGNQAMKFGQLIELNIRNIFLEKYLQNVVEKLLPDPFSKYHN